MSTKAFAAIDAVAMQIGTEKTVELLQFALPIVIERQHTLEQHLLAGEWGEAKHCAHKSISSVRFYGSERLETLLRQVTDIDNGECDPLALQQELSKAFEAAIDNIREWLALH